MFDVTKFNDRNGWTIKDLARRLFDKGGESRVGMWSSGDSNPRYESILKLIDLGATAQELFGEELGTKLIQNSIAVPPAGLANDPEFQKGLQQSIDAKVSATVKTELEKILKQKGLL